MNKLREVVLELVKVMPKSVVETAKRASKSNMRFAVASSVSSSSSA